MTAHRPAVVVFDVVETLFSLAPVGDALAAVGADLDLYFALLLRDAFALTAAGDYRPFPDVARGAVQAVAPDAGEDDIEAVLDAFRRLPPHDDVAPALRILREAGVPAVALSNGGQSATDKLLEANGLHGHFARVIGVDGAGAWKPHESAYRHAADELDLPPGKIALVAVHSWDIHGARRAGLVTGWCSRLEGRVSPVFDGADVAGDDLVDVVERLLQLSQ